MQIDLDRLVPGSKFFRWRELLWLPQWNVHVFPTDLQYLNLIELCRRADKVRKYLDQPMTVTSGLRPKRYNKEIGGATFSMHMRGMAMDFFCRKIKADRVREILLPVLDDFDLRMEDLPGSSWVHIDCWDGGTQRYFKP